MQLKSQEMRKLAPELDPLRLGTGWTKEDLGKVQVMVESTYGDSHPGSGHLNVLVEEVRKGIAEEGGFGARYYCTDICDGESQGTDGINYSLASREMIANMIEIHANATPFDAGVYLSSCDKGVPGNLMGLARVNIPSVFVPGGTMNAGPEMLTLEQLGMYSAKFERGEIDEEITVPELVKEGSLCPHQDYVYFNYPTKEEQDAFAAFVAEVDKSKLMFQKLHQQLNILQQKAGDI